MVWPCAAEQGAASIATAAGTAGQYKGQKLKKTRYEYTKAGIKGLVESI